MPIEWLMPCQNLRPLLECCCWWFSCRRVALVPFRSPRVIKHNSLRVSSSKNFFDRYLLQLLYRANTALEKLAPPYTYTDHVSTDYKTKSTSLTTRYSVPTSSARIMQIMIHNVIILSSYRRTANCLAKFISTLVIYCYSLGNYAVIILSI